MLTQYFAIHPQILRIDSQRSFNVFTINSDNHYTLFHPAGEKYTALFHRLIFKNSISQLYVKKCDTYLYHKYIEQMLPIILDDPFISSKCKAKIAHDAVTSIAMTIIEHPDTDTVIRYKKVITSITDFVIKQEDAIKKLFFHTKATYHEYNHLVNVGIYGMGLALQVLNQDEHNLHEIFSGFFLHDIGKYRIPKHIYQKKGPLTNEEWILMKKHPEEGCNILKKFNLITPEIEIITLQHHERYNGSGYPNGLFKNQIHIYGKICAIADSFDALSSQRPYRNRQTSFNALGIMQNELKNGFDEELFKRFVILFGKPG